MDLLGYGAMLRPVGFNPSAPEAQIAVSRLEEFQAKAAEYADRYQRALIINDGVAYVRQLSPRTVSVTYDFLYRAFRAFQEVNTVEAAKGFPGARMVLAAGPRLRISNATRPAKEHRDAILRKLHDNKMTAEQAVHAAARIMPYTGSIVELQANFAFTKAFLADQAGSRAGLSGPNFYVDSCVFCDDSPPAWIKVEAEIQWATEGMSATFYRVACIDNDAAGASMHKGMRSALDVANRLQIVF